MASARSRSHANSSSYAVLPAGQADNYGYGQAFAIVGVVLATFVAIVVGLIVSIVVGVACT